MKDSKRRKITRNALVCMDCDDLIESKYRHDFVSCKCGAIFVDGGHDYLRHGGDWEKMIELYEFDDE